MTFSMQIHDREFANTDYTGPILYLIHYPKPLNRTRHYIGICERGRFEARMREHAFGHGSSLTHQLSKRNNTLYVTKIWWPADFEMETKIKKAGHHEKRCVFCSAKLAHNAYATVKWEPWGMAADRAAVLGSASQFPTNGRPQTQTHE